MPFRLLVLLGVPVWRLALAGSQFTFLIPVTLLAFAKYYFGCFAKMMRTSACYRYSQTTRWRFRTTLVSDIINHQVDFASLLIGIAPHAESQTKTGKP